MALFQRAQLTLDVHSTKRCCCCHRRRCCISCSFSSCGHTQITPKFVSRVGREQRGAGQDCGWWILGVWFVTTSMGTASVGRSETQMSCPWGGGVSVLRGGAAIMLGGRTTSDDLDVGACGVWMGSPCSPGITPDTWDALLNQNPWHMVMVSSWRSL